MSDRAALATIALVSAAVVAGVGLLLLGPRPAGLPAGGPVVRWPALNAALNAASAACLAAGYLLIRGRRVVAHRACMLAAFALSCLFLVSYVVYHATAGSVPFPGRGPLRVVYFALLLSHIVLAAAIVPLALVTLYRAWTGRFDRHRRIARWTLPLWLYVSVSGVLVYWMLYHLPPSP